MTESRELKVVVTYRPEFQAPADPMITDALGDVQATYNVKGFHVTMEGNALKGKYDFYIIPDGGSLVLFPFNTPRASNSPLLFIAQLPGEPASTILHYKEDFAPIAQAVQRYEMTEEEAEAIEKNFEPETKALPKEALEFFGGILKKILEGAGFVIVELEKQYFASPTPTSILTPMFSLGIRKEPVPPKIEEGYETTVTFLSFRRGLTNVSVQLKLLDLIPGERLAEVQRAFRDHLTPYGLKCLYLVIEECGKNKRIPWFSLDTNRCLDLLGYSRKKDGGHQIANKALFRKELEALTRINFNVERRLPPKGGVPRKDRTIRFIAPLISFTGKFEEIETDPGQPLSEGKIVREGKQIFIHPEIYKFIDGWYTFIPNDYLKIDVGRHPHAVALYSYIANQWRIGWNTYGGVIRQTLRQVLDGAGLADLPKRKDHQGKAIERIKEDLRWLRGQPQFWIKTMRFETQNRPVLDQIVTIETSDDHPLKSSMKLAGDPKESRRITPGDQGTPVRPGGKTG